MTRKGAITIDDREKILARLRIKTLIVSECWLWQGSTNGRGYGEIRIDNKKYYVHRIAAYLFHNYPLNSIEQVNHSVKCSNRNCWNPEHIYVGNQQDNMRDAMILGYEPGKFQTLKTHCPQGHEYSEENTYTWNNERQCRICRAKRIELSLK